MNVFILPAFYKHIQQNLSKFVPLLPFFFFLVFDHYLSFNSMKYMFKGIQFSPMRKKIVYRFGNIFFQCYAIYNYNTGKITILLMNNTLYSCM